MDAISESVNERTPNFNPPPRGADVAESNPEPAAKTMSVISSAKVQSSCPLVHPDWAIEDESVRGDISQDFVGVMHNIPGVSQVFCIGRMVLPICAPASPVCA